MYIFCYIHVYILITWSALCINFGDFDSLATMLWVFISSKEEMLLQEQVIH